MRREAAARSVGMDRQTLRDWVVRYNADGIEGLADRWGDGRPPRLDAAERAELAEVILAGPDPEVDGISAYTLEDLAVISAQRFGKPFHRASMSRVVEPGTDNAFALVMPEASTRAMQIYLDKLSATVAADEHVLLVLDQAGWHGANDLQVPASITLLPLPPRSPELNPVERLWLFLVVRLHARLEAAAKPNSRVLTKSWVRSASIATRGSNRLEPREDFRQRDAEGHQHDDGGI